MTIELNAFWEFINKRHTLFMDRYLGRETTIDDVILNNYKFTNVYRILDRTTQYILKEVINDGSDDIFETFYRILLFRFFNKMSTWDYIKQEGFHLLTNFDFDKLTQSLEHFKQTTKNSVYASAYTANWGAGAMLKGESMIKQHLYLIQYLLDNNEFYEVKSASESMESFFKWITSKPMIGAFIGYQMTLDLSYSNAVPWQEDTFVVTGTGSKQGLRLLEKGTTILGLRDSQLEPLTNLGFEYIVMPNGKKRLLSIADIEHCLCEFHKYNKYSKFYNGESSQQRVGKQYIRTDKPLTMDVPEKWYT